MSSLSGEGPFGVDAKLEQVRKRLNAVTSDVQLLRSQIEKLRFDESGDLMAVVQKNVGNVVLKEVGTVTGSGSGVDVDVSNYEFGMVCINVATVNGKFAKGQGLTVEIQGKDEVNGVYKTIAEVYCSTVVGTRFVEVNPVYWEHMKTTWTLVGTSTSVTFGVSMQSKG